MRIEKARELGFCFGVRRALKIIENAASNSKGIVTLGPIVHNRTVVERLKSMGVGIADGVENLKGEAIAISSHGISPAVQKKILSKGMTVIDTTCPTVRSAQKAARRLARDGFEVIIFGEASHPEVKGLLGWAGESAIASTDAGEVDIKSIPKRLGILAQTTQRPIDFVAFVNELVKRLLPKVLEIRVMNTLCQETQKRQAAAEDLARTSDLMVVVGGRNSANTRRLAEVCVPLVETHHIENADEIETAWLKHKEAVGITAGTSTPDEAIEQVVAKIAGLQP